MIGLHRMYVFRISKGNESGTPIGKCPLDYSNIKNIIKNLPKSKITPIDYDNNGHLEFIFDELWKRKILRQGWGIENLDLEQDVKSWIENYMLSAKIFWNKDINCDEAKGRWNILYRIYRINKDDILFIPKTSKINLNDQNKFTVCKVEQEYYFDYPKHIQDFGHCLKVKHIQDFVYGNDTLLKSDFGTPYLWAVTEIKEHHSRFNKFRNFVQEKIEVL